MKSVANKPIMLSVIMLNVIMLNAVRLSVVASLKDKNAFTKDRVSSPSGKLDCKIALKNWHVSMSLLNFASLSHFKF
jgi:hypothetical protein